MVKVPAWAVSGVKLGKELSPMTKINYFRHQTRKTSSSCTFIVFLSSYS